MLCFFMLIKLLEQGVFSSRDCISNESRVRIIGKEYEAFCHLTHPFVFRAVIKPRVLFFCVQDLGCKTLADGTPTTEGTHPAGG